MTTAARRTPQEIGRANRRAGMEHERATLKALTDAGWLAVLSKRSLGAADIMALAPAGDGPGDAWLVQCKSNGQMSEAAKRALLNLGLHYTALPVVAYWHKEGRAAKVIKFKRLDGTEIEP